MGELPLSPLGIKTPLGMKLNKNFMIFEWHPPCVALTQRQLAATIPWSREVGALPAIPRAGLQFHVNLHAIRCGIRAAFCDKSRLRTEIMAESGACARRGACKVISRRGKL